MKVNFTTVSKVFLIGFAVSNFSHLLSLLDIHETLVHAPSYLSFWWWHAILFLAYAVLPLSAVLIGHAVFCLLVTSVSLVGILLNVSVSNDPNFNEKRTKIKIMELNERNTR
jgi:hypothetical protein